MHKSTGLVGWLGAVALGIGLFLLPTLLPYASSGDVLAIPAWSRKYDVTCQMCHAPNFARLNYYGERFLANGYQSPDLKEADGDTEGKKKYSDHLSLDNEIGHWFTARLNLTPVQLETKALTVKGEKKDKLTIGNTNWLQLFVAGSLSKNTSIYIENEFSAGSEPFHQAWYYLGLHNLGNTSWLNFQAGRLSPVVFAPYPDRLPQLPPIGGGALRVTSSNGGGVSSVDMRSPRYGIQYYGYQGPVSLYAGVTPGSKNSNAANQIGVWGGLRLWMPESGAEALKGSSLGIHFDSGTDAKNPANKPTDSLAYAENSFVRIMPGLNLRWKDKFDLQAAYVMGTEDNRKLVGTGAKEIAYNGIRAVGSYFVNERWILSFHYDNVTTSDEDKANLAAADPLKTDYQFLYIPVVTYLMRENIRVSLYPGLDLRDKEKISDKENHHLFYVNIRAAI
ncbi:hypothetical protein HZB60_02950 [candidate division KSB1 bacterium]|nr:hypothetical protein [candidate division KSB1 bacterium]